MIRPSSSSAGQIGRLALAAARLRLPAFGLLLALASAAWGAPASVPEPATAPEGATAQAPAPATAPAASAAAAPAAPLPEVIIDPGGVSPEALSAINDAVAAISRLAGDQDGGETNRLRRRARDATISALATQGYFAPQVTLQAGTDVAGETWDIAIVPGQRAVVHSVDIRVIGRAAEPDYAERIAALRKAWPLPAGQPFVNEVWNRAKTTLLDDLSERDFFLARLVQSQAQVDPDTAQVRLTLTLDSGPQVRLGPLSISGLERTPAKLVHRYVRYEPGQPYDRNKLETWQQQLQTTSFFRGAFVYVVRPGADTAREAGASDTAKDDRIEAGLAGASAVAPVDAGARQVELPVQVRVVEAAARRISFGVGVDDTAGVRFETQYRQNVVFGQPLSLESGVGVDRLRQRAYLDFYLPPDAKGNRDSFGLLADHTDIEGLDVTRLALGATRLRQRKGAGDSRVEYETRYGALLAHDRIKIDEGDQYTLPTATLTAEWLRRDVDSKYDPREGNLIVLGGGVGVTLDTGEPYTRARARAQKWWPIGRQDVLTIRSEVGKLWSDSRTQVPDDFGFRTGGARSIRGYKYLSLGQQRDGAVVGASALLVGSVEYMHYFDERFGIGVFVDAGDAAESFKDMDIALGYGVGARVRTPAGPLFLDLAWGQRERRLRLHFSLGIAF